MQFSLQPSQISGADHWLRGDTRPDTQHTCTRHTTYTAQRTHNHKLKPQHKHKHEMTCTKCLAPNMRPTRSLPISVDQRATFSIQSTATHSTWKLPQFFTLCLAIAILARHSSLTAASLWHSGLPATHLPWLLSNSHLA